MTNPNLKPFLRTCFLCASMLCGLSFLLPMSAEGALRAVAGGGGSSGGSTPGASCTNNGGMVYGSAGALVCSSAVTTDGNGAVSASGLVTAGTLTVTGVSSMGGTVSVSTGANVTNAYTAVSQGTIVYNVFNSGCGGLVAGSPCLQIGTGSGLSTGLLLGTLANGQTALWSTNAALTTSNYILMGFNSGYTQINGANGVILQGAGTGLAQATSTAWQPFSASGLTLGTSGNPWGNVFTTGAISGGSLTANSNGIETAQTTWGAVTTGAIVSAGAPVTNGTVTNIVNLSSLPAGVYDISAQCNWDIFGATVTQQQCGISYTATTFLTSAGGTSGGATIGNDPYTHSWQAPIAATTSDISLNTMPVRVKCTSACTIFHTSALTFSVGTAKAFGSIRARRVQ